MTKRYNCIAVDFDGTLAQYDYWRPCQFGEPIPPMVERVKRWLREGTRVIIFTAREEFEQSAVADWTEKHIGERLEVTNRKLSCVDAFYDDRAVRVEFNTGKLLSPEK